MNLGDAAKRAFALQDYSPQAPIGGVEVVDLKRFVDDGGAFVELGRLTAGAHAAFRGFEVRQVNYSEVDPGVIKAFHLHRRQSDVWFVPPGDRMLLVLLDCRAGSPTENALRRMILGDGATRLVRIPPGVAHGVRNVATSRGRIIYFVDTQFSADPDTSDEGRLPWDFAGLDVWEPTRG
ncbi:MAG TPA: dTDP-4-dehydrorhamnose 3,5-epimerase family protein [Methylomirabilota bacterium]|nr:dTDP-4-dehydrorhamnose 3,5-epimerase family protein [Methylomirabilota bacterium]